MGTPRYRASRKWSTAELITWSQPSRRLLQTKQFILSDARGFQPPSPFQKHRSSGLPGISCYGNCFLASLYTSCGVSSSRNSGCCDATGSSNKVIDSGSANADCDACGSAQQTAHSLSAVFSASNAKGAALDLHSSLSGRHVREDEQSFSEPI